MDMQNTQARERDEMMIMNGEWIVNEYDWTEDHAHDRILQDENAIDPLGNFGYCDVNQS